MTMRNYNPAMLCDFYEFTMSNGYFQTATIKKRHILMFSSEKYPTAAALPLPQDSKALLSI